MKIAIMQPYLFPYIGYFQLINLVDKFVIYDDVNFINKGWINRNNILVNSGPNLFTVPLLKQSQNHHINEILIHDKEFIKWKLKFYKTISATYKKAPYYSQINPIITELFDSNIIKISSLSFKSLLLVCRYLDIRTDFVESSTVYNNTNLTGQDRILDICKQEQVNHYINPIGGIELYDNEKFRKNGIKLSFIKPKNILYKQHTKEFVPWLSIIDVLMFNDPRIIKQMLYEFELI